MITSALPWLLKTEMYPGALVELGPTATSTRLGIVTPAVQFKLDASGRGALSGKMVRKLGAVVLVTVTLRTTAETPVTGTVLPGVARPPTGTSRPELGP